MALSPMARHRGDFAPLSATHADVFFPHAELEANEAVFAGLADCQVGATS